VAVAVAVAVAVDVSGGLSGGLPGVVSEGLASGVAAGMVFSTVFSTVTLRGALGAACSPSWLPLMSKTTRYPTRNPMRNPTSTPTANLTTPPYSCACNPFSCPPCYPFIHCSKWVEGGATSENTPSGHLGVNTGKMKEGPEPLGTPAQLRGYAGLYRLPKRPPVFLRSCLSRDFSA
jgi:hypothetical protein